MKRLLSAALLIGAFFMLPGFKLDNAIVPKEEILSGGPPKDGIPAILEPKFIKADEAHFLEPDDQVIGVFDNCSCVKKWALAEPLIAITLKNKILGHAHLWYQPSEPLTRNIAHTPLDDSLRWLVGDLILTLMATHKDTALRSLAQAHQRLYQFALPVASHPSNPDDLTLRHAQRNPLDR